MPDVMTLLGATAAACTSLSYVPQVRKALPRQSTDDLSWKTLAALTAGLMLWIAYGFMKSDPVIVLANCVGASLSGCVLLLKIRDMRADGATDRNQANSNGLQGINQRNFNQQH